MSGALSPKRPGQHSSLLGESFPISQKQKEETKSGPKEAALSTPLSLDGNVPEEDHYTILYGDTGYSFETIFGKYLEGAKAISVEDPYVRSQHLIQNLVRFCELVVKTHSVKEIRLVTGFDNDTQRAEAHDKFEMLQDSLQENDIDLK